MESPAINLSYLILQGLDLPSIEFPYLGTRGLVGIVMLIHIFFATLFVGYAIGSPLLQAWSVRTGDSRFERLAHSLARFNLLTFSVGATWAVMFLVVLVGLYPRVASALFTHFFWFFPVGAMVSMLLTLWLFYFHYYRARNRALPKNIAAGLAAAFFILVWQTILTGMDTFMVTGGGSGGQVGTAGISLRNTGEAFDNLASPMSLTLNIHRIFGNLSWPAYAVAAWAGFMYARSKREEDKSFYDWASSMGVVWGTVFLLIQPLAGFFIALSMKNVDYGAGELSAAGASGSYERLVGSGAESTFTSNLLYINLAMVVGLFVISNAAMYLGAARHSERAGRLPIQLFGLVAALAGLYSISPIADWPFLYMRYIMIGIMVVATVGALITYVRGRGRFVYGSPGGRYRAALLALGVLAAVVTLNMGFMKSNSRVPYTIYGDESYRVENETPISPEGLGTENSGAP